MNKLFIVALLLFSSWCVRSQTAAIDSIIHVLKHTKDDRVKVLGIAELSRQMAWYNPDSAYTLALKGIMLSRQINFYEGEMYCKVSAAACSWSLANYALAIELLLPLIPAAIKTKDIILKVEVFANLHNAYRDQGDYVEALKYLKIAEYNLPFIDHCTRCKLGKAMLAFAYFQMGQKDSMNYYLKTALQYPASSFPLSEGWIYSVAGLIYTNQMKYDAAFFYYQLSIPALIQENNQKDLAWTYNNISSLFTSTGKPDSALVYLNKSIAISKARKFAREAMESNLLLAQVYESIKSDSALYYFKKAIIAKDSLYNQEKQKQILGYKFKQDLDQLEAEAEKKQNENRLRQYLLLGLVVFSLALTFLLIRNNRHKQKANALLQAKNRALEIDAALERVRVSAMAMRKTEDLHHTVSLVFEELKKLNIGVIRCGISIINKEKRTGDIWATSITEQGSAIQVSGDEPFDIHPLLQDAFEAWMSQKDTYYVLQGDDLTRYYKAVNASNLQLPALPINLSVTGTERQYCYTAVYRAGGLFAFKETEFSEEAKHLMRRFANVFDLTYKRFLDLQVKEIQTIRLNEEKEKLENTLFELRATQAQLIQSEKLASLGELTAGIAHEIQNPLNFVNNFAEVSAEMLGEMKEEIKAGNTSEIIALASDLEQNLSKINHHGQRASSIVKGMLEHSRASTGVKELTDLNALADEYLRLAYHGLRAKDNNFNIKMETHFDPDLPKVSVIPQDIGRVLLNLINNAFYAVAERRLLSSAEVSRSTVQQRASVGVTSSHADTMYQPTIAVSTQKTANHILITIKDNGNGIPEGIRDKIFQPFFTTKPTGQGTGLGLSLAYDIIKTHGGTLEVFSTPKESTTFILSIPN